MIATAFATIPHCKVIKQHKSSKYCEQLCKQLTDMTCMCNHFAVCAAIYNGLLSWPWSRVGRDNTWGGSTKKQV